MRRALLGLRVAPHQVFIDGNRCPCPDGLGFECLFESVVKGDATVPSISAASIMAKTTRDALMRELDGRYPGFFLSGHKGYPTPTHVAAIEALGPSPLHRRSFSPIRAANFAGRLKRSERLARAGPCSASGRGPRAVHCAPQAERHGCAWPRAMSRPVRCRCAATAMSDLCALERYRQPPPVSAQMRATRSALMSSARLPPKSPVPGCAASSLTVASTKAATRSVPPSRENNESAGALRATPPAEASEARVSRSAASKGRTSIHEHVPENEFAVARIIRPGARWPV